MYFLMLAMSISALEWCCFAHFLAQCCGVCNEVCMLIHFLFWEICCLNHSSQHTIWVPVWSRSIADVKCAYCTSRARERQRCRRLAPHELSRCSPIWLAAMSEPLDRVKRIASHLTVAGSAKSETAFLSVSLSGQTCACRL